MKILRHLVISLVVLCLTAAVCARADDKPANPVNFGSSENVLELKSALSPYRAPGGTVEPDEPDTPGVVSWRRVEPSRAAKIAVREEDEPQFFPHSLWGR